MKVIIIHGDDINTSYARFTKLTDVARGRGWEIVDITESGASIAESLSFTSLFPTERFFVLTKVKRVTKEDSVWLATNAKDMEGNLMVYSDSKIPKATLDLFPKESKVEEFSLPFLVYKFIDSIYPGNINESIALYKKTIAVSDVEMVFAMLSRSMRELFAVSANKVTSFVPSWKKSKLAFQTSKFSKDKIAQFINDLALIDLRVKRSKGNLSDLLALHLVRNLQ